MVTAMWLRDAKGLALFVPPFRRNKKAEAKRSLEQPRPQASPPQTFYSSTNYLVLFGSCTKTKYSFGKFKKGFTLKIPKTALPLPLMLA